MALGIVATDSHAGHCTLAVTGAAHIGTSKYASDFSAGVDSWTGDPGSTGITPTLTGNVSIAGVKALRMTGATFNDQSAKRTVTGLTVSSVYRLTAKLRATNQYGIVGYVGVVGIGNSDGETLQDNNWTDYTYDFTATATSHDIKVFRATGSALAALLIYDVHVVLLSSGSLSPAVIERQDVNGSEFVRLQDGQDVDSSGNLTVIDYEPAAHGTVTYIVRDGLGALASTSLTMSGPAFPLLSSVGLPVAAHAITRLDDINEDLQYAQLQVNTKAVIGRQDPLTQTTEDYGWTKRQGTLVYYAQDRVELAALRDIHTEGRICLLRFHDAPDPEDLYYVSTAARSRKRLFASNGSDGWDWQLEVDYIETGWPDGPLAGNADWTYAALDASYLAYFDLPGAFATYADLKAGP